MGSSARGPGSPPTEQPQVVRSIADLEKRARQTSGIQLAEERLDTELTRTSRALRRVRTGYAYQPPAYRTYRRRRATCPQGPTYCTYGVRVPAWGVWYVPRTVATQVR